jgi:hypothetical protein
MRLTTRPARQDAHNGFRPAGHPKGRHSGLDFGWASGDDIFAAGDGIVSYVFEDAGYNQGWGRRVIIRHTDRAETTYNHMKPGGVHVDEGQRVSAGRHIGDMGESGEAPNGRHLHFELYIDGVRVDPQPYLDGKALPGKPVIADEPEGTPAGSGSTVKSTQRIVRRAVRRRAEPTTKSKNVTKPNALLTPGTIGNFTGFIRGEMVEQNGVRSRIWYRGISGDWFWAGNFTEIAAEGLRDLGTYKPKATSKPKPKRRYVRFTEPWFVFDTEADARNAQKGHRGPTLPAGDYLIVDQSADKASPFRVYVKGASGRKVYVGTPRTAPRVVTK